MSFDGDPDAATYGAMLLDQANQYAEMYGDEAGHGKHADDGILAACEQGFNDMLDEYEAFCGATGECQDYKK
jgi:hypothetical protein